MFGKTLVQIFQAFNEIVEYENIHPGYLGLINTLKSESRKRKFSVEQYLEYLAENLTENIESEELKERQKEVAKLQRDLEKQIKERKKLEKSKSNTVSTKPELSSKSNDSEKEKTNERN